MSAHLLSLGSLFMVCLATLATPGPNNFMLMRLGMRRGRGAATWAGIGATISCAVWCVGALVGLAAVLASAPWLYKALRIGGGLYLVYFAIMLWRARAETPQLDGEAPPMSPLAALWQGFAINMTNPKSLLFFAAIFSAYIGPDTPFWMRLAAMLIVCASCLGWQLAMAWLFSSRRAASAYGRAQRPLDRGAAVLMGAFGASLIWLE